MKNIFFLILVLILSSRANTLEVFGKIDSSDIRFIKAAAETCGLSAPIARMELCECCGFERSPCFLVHSIVDTIHLNGYLVSKALRFGALWDNARVNAYSCYGSNLDTLFFTDGEIPRAVKISGGINRSIVIQLLKFAKSHSIPKEEAPSEICRRNDGLYQIIFQSGKKPQCCNLSSNIFTVSIKSHQIDIIDSCLIVE
jgi:hypothetical protein